MFKTIVFSAFGAGLAVCAALTVLQQTTTEPQILNAEVFEDASGGHVQDHADAIVADANEHADAAAGTSAGVEAWSPADGLERTVHTVLANLVIGVAVALVLLGGMVLKGDPIDGRRGLLWGLAGFAAASLLPALGLPPELPGTPAADLLSRQAWWIGTAVASAAGIACLVFGRHRVTLAAGVVLLIAPHLVGAPPPPSHDAAYPAALAGEFVAASIIVSAALWSIAGFTAGWLHQRLSRTA